MKSLKTILPEKLDSWAERACSLPLIGPLFRHPFTKFGTVGLIGTGINLAVLYIGQEVLFQWIALAGSRLKASLALAIFLSTFHNYLWNRSWTWGERKRAGRTGFFIQMIQYFLACGVAIGLQYLLTLVLATFVHYIPANIIAITLAAVVTYLLNDVWTFARGRAQRVS